MVSQARALKAWSAALALAAPLLLLIWMAGPARGQEPVPPSPNAARQAAPPEAAQNAASVNSAKQNNPSAAQQDASKKPDAQPEMSGNDSQAIFRLKVNLVLVRVVVRDAAGHAVDHLRQEDFRLLDEKKPQVISQFAVEHAGAAPPAPAAESREHAPETVAREGSADAPLQSSIARRYVGLYFDDVQARFADMARVRDAALRYIGISLAPDDRAGLFTSSGQGNVDFTDDREKLRQGLTALRSRSLYATTAACPDLDQYQSDLIINHNDGPALRTATAEARHCQYNDDARMQNAAQAYALAQAGSVVNTSEGQNQYSLGGLEGLVRRMITLPGQRNILMVSPGFFAQNEESQVNDLIDHALKENVVINALDVRGLYTPLRYDVSEEHVIVSAQTEGIKDSLRTTAEQLNSEVLSNLAQATGGNFFHNSNDMDAGMRVAGALPEVAYVLGFSPTGQKLNGRFHRLQVNLASKGKYTVQARRGYFAANKAADPVEQARQDIEEAVFSQEELSDIPIEVHTQYFKTGDADSGARLSVLTHVDVKSMHFQKDGDRNRDDLTLVTALFDRDGNYVNGTEKLVHMQLRDATRLQLTRSGITLSAKFDVKPGNYMVRAVVRDSEGALVSARNRAVEIPY